MRSTAVSAPWSPEYLLRIRPLHYRETAPFQGHDSLYHKPLWTKTPRSSDSLHLTDEGTKTFFFFSFLGSNLWQACGSSQARGQIGAAAAGLHHSHSNAGSEPCLNPTPQLTMPQCHIPKLLRVRPGIELASSWILIGFISSVPQCELQLRLNK